MIPSLKIASIACLLCLAAATSIAQTVRVDEYQLTTFQASWDSLRTPEASTGVYIGGSNEGIFSLALPFDFPYDGRVVPQGTMISVGANGAISLMNAEMPSQQFVGNPALQALIGPFSANIKQGADARTPGVDTFGYYQVTGNLPERVLTIEWRGFHFIGAGNQGGQIDTLASMQAKLYETTGVIEFIYRDHGLELPSRFPEVKATIGLNGFATPDFRTRIHASETRIIPATDLRWTPGTASVDITNSADIQIYPNPTTGRTRLKLPAGESITQVIVSDGLGRAYALPANEGMIDLSALESGSYLTKIVTARGPLFRRICIVR